MYSLERYTEQLILSNPARRLPRAPAFALNPFHWAFSALSAGKSWELPRDKVFRFGRHLSYARQHHVPEEFLVGFLYQAGTPSEVEKKAGDGATEIWRDRWIMSRRLD